MDLIRKILADGGRDPLGPAQRRYCGIATLRSDVCGNYWELSRCERTNWVTAVAIAHGSCDALGSSRVISVLNESRELRATYW